MRKIFKDFSISQLEELMKRLKEKVKKGGFDEIEDCELLVQAYACGYGDRIKDIVAWMEIPDYAAEERHCHD